MQQICQQVYHIVPSQATGSVQEIGSLIMELGIKYTLDDRLDAIATDNGANFVAAMEDLLENGICEERDVRQTLQLSIKNHFDPPKPKNASASTNATSELIAVFRKLVNKIHGCSLLTENLRSAQSGGPIINLLVEDEQDDGEHQVNEGASDAAPKDASFHSSPRGHTLKLIKLLCDFMKPFQVVTDYLQGETYPILGSLSRKISQLMLYLSRPKPPQSWGLGKTCADTSQSSVMFARLVLADIKRRGDTGNLLLGMAAVVDPHHISL
eukprot:Em0100g1a